jgi:hypothetical protein
MSTPSSDPLVAHTGDAESAALLRRNLTAMADQHRGTALARHVREVLAGQRDLADLEGDPDFMRLVRRGVQQYEDHVASLSAEEKERLYAEAREIAEQSEDPGPR